MYLFTGFGVTAGAHRLFTHRTFAPVPIVRDLLALAFLMSAQGSLERWVRDHSIHHRHSDLPSDPHSPRQHGFFAAHVGWLWKKPASRDEARALYIRWTRGLNAGRAGRFFRSGGRLAALHLGVVYAAYIVGAFMESGVSLEALLRGWHTGVSFVVWGVLLRIVLVMHSTFFVNSAAHLWGGRRYETRDDSRNLWWVAVMALGEGWHNNHHGRPSAANNGFHAWWEFDLTFLLLLALGTLGLVHDVKVWRPTKGHTESWFRGRQARAPEDSPEVG
jgi:fatty-acid desaturase